VRYPVRRSGLKYPPNLESKPGHRAQSPSFGLWFSPISDLSFPLHIGLFPLYEKSSVKGVVCPVENRKKILIYNLIKILPPIFRHTAMTSSYT